MKFFYSIILAGIIVWLGSASFTYLPLLFRSGGLATVVANLNAAVLVIPIVAGGIAAVVLFRILNKNLINRVSRKVTITSAGVFLVVLLFAIGLGYGIDEAGFHESRGHPPLIEFIAVLAIAPLACALFLLTLYHATPSRTRGSERKS